MVKIIIGVVIIGFIVLGTFMFIDPNLNKTTSTTTTTETVSTTFSATIEGEVYKAGTYTLPEGATMSDLISAAGGALDTADELSYFETAELTSGSSYYIAPKYDTSDICGATEIEKVNINTATKEELMEVSGFTSSISTSLITYRTENGTFYTIEALMNVYGIGNATYRKVRNYVILHE